jgi:hypothetical protein
VKSKIMSDIVHGPNSNSSSIGMSVARPTEAQLRWAQFRRKSLWNQSMDDRFRNLYPENPSDIPEALSDDGEETTSSSNNNSDDKGLRCSHNSISKGRRALVRVSQRRYLQRRREIDLYGFQHTTTTTEENDPRSNTSSSVVVVDDDIDDDDEASVTGNSFIVDPDGNITVASNRRRKQRRRYSEKSERLRRFEMAFQIALDSIAANKNNALIMADEEDGHGRYTERTRGRSKPRTSLHNPVPPPPPPIDRGASWLQHLPTPIKHKPHTPLHHSPAKKKRNRPSTTTTEWSPEIETTSPDFYRNLQMAMQKQQEQHPWQSSSVRADGKDDESFTLYNPHNCIAQAITYDSEDENEMNDNSDARRRSMVFQRPRDGFPPINFHQPPSTERQIIATTVSEDTEFANDEKDDVNNYRHQFDKIGAQQPQNSKQQPRTTSCLYPDLPVSPREHSLAVNALLADLTPPPPQTNTIKPNHPRPQVDEEQLHALLFLSPTTVPGKTNNHENDNDNDTHTIIDPRVSITSTIVEVGGAVELGYEHSEEDENDQHHRVDEQLSKQAQILGNMLAHDGREKSSCQTDYGMSDDGTHDSEQVEVAHFTQSLSPNEGKDDDNTHAQVIMNPFLDESSSVVMSPMTPKSDGSNVHVAAGMKRIMDESEIPELSAMTFTENQLLASSSKETEIIVDEPKIGRPMDRDEQETPLPDESSSVTEETSIHGANHNDTDESSGKSVSSSNDRNSVLSPTVVVINHENESTLVVEAQSPGKLVNLSRGRKNNTVSSATEKAMDFMTLNEDMASTFFVTEKENDEKDCNSKDNCSDCETENEFSSETKVAHPAGTMMADNDTNSESKIVSCVVNFQNGVSAHLSTNKPPDNNRVHLEKSDHRESDPDAVFETTNTLRLTLHEPKKMSSLNHHTNALMGFEYGEAKHGDVNHVLHEKADIYSNQNGDMSAKIFSSILNPPGHKDVIEFCAAPNSAFHSERIMESSEKESLKEPLFSQNQSMLFNKSSRGQKTTSSWGRLSSVAARKRVTFRAVAMKSAEIVFDRLEENDRKKIGDPGYDAPTTGKAHADSFVNDLRQNSETLCENRSECAASDVDGEKAINKEIDDDRDYQVTNFLHEEKVSREEKKIADGWSFDLTDDQPQSPELSFLDPSRASPRSRVVSTSRLASSLTDNNDSHSYPLLLDEKERHEAVAGEIPAKNYQTSANNSDIKPPDTPTSRQQQSSEGAGNRKSLSETSKVSSSAHYEGLAYTLTSACHIQSSKKLLSNFSVDIASPAWPDLSSIYLEMPDQNKGSNVLKESCGTDLSSPETITEMNDKRYRQKESVIDFQVDKPLTHETDLPVKSATDPLNIGSLDQRRDKNSIGFTGKCVSTKNDGIKSNATHTSLYNCGKDHFTAALNPSSSNATPTICTTPPDEKGISIELGDELAKKKLMRLPVDTLPFQTFRDFDEDFFSAKMDDSLNCVLGNPNEILPDTRFSKNDDDKYISSDDSEDPFASILHGNDFSRISNLPSETRSSSSFISTDHNKSDPLLALFCLMTLEPQISGESTQCEDSIVSTATALIATENESGLISTNNDVSFCVESSSLPCSSKVKETMQDDTTFTATPLKEISRLEWDFTDVENAQVKESLKSDAIHWNDPKTKRNSNGCGIRSREEITKIFFRNDVEYDVQWERRLLL